MTHIIQDELTDEQLAQAVGGQSWSGPVTLNGGATVGAATSGLAKTGTGHLILPTADTYSGTGRLYAASEVGVF